MSHDAPYEELGRVYARSIPSIVRPSHTPAFELLP